VETALEGAPDEGRRRRRTRRRRRRSRIGNGRLRHVRRAKRPQPRHLGRE